MLYESVIRLPALRCCHLYLHTTACPEHTTSPLAGKRRSDGSLHAAAPSWLQLMTNVLKAEQAEGGVDLVMFGGDQVGGSIQALL